MAMKRLWVVIVALLVGIPAYAMTDSSATVSTSASTVLAAASGSTPRRNIHIVNRSTDNIWCKWTGTAAAAAAGNFPLLGQGATIIYGPSGQVPQEALSCISSGASSGLTILVSP